MIRLGHFYVDASPDINGRRYWLFGWKNTNHAGGYTLRQILGSAWRELLYYAGWIKYD